MKSTFKLKHIFPLLLIFLAGSNVVSAQELNCNVTVLSPTIQQTNKQVFTSLENSIEEFMNSRRWTSDNFGVTEKIECNILINITGVSGTDYSGTIQIQSSRPVYGTNYNSPMLNIFDKTFAFNYIEFQPLEYQEGTYLNELTAVLSYYAYIILGYDYDSFSSLGGTQQFQQAQNIVNAAQSSTATGWNALEKNRNNRYYLINQLLDDRNTNFRKLLYTYHRQGMDIMASEMEKGLDHVLSSLETIQILDKTSPNLYITRLFFDAKAKELADLFSQAGATQKYKAKEILTRMDISNISLYNDKLK